MLPVGSVTDYTGAECRGFYGCSAAVEAIVVLLVMTSSGM